MSDARDLDDVRDDPNPIRRGRRATELITQYDQYKAELARIRKDAIDRAHDDLDMNYSEIAPQMGMTKARLSQILKTAPVAERLFFGMGPVTIGVPYRYQTTDRERPLIAAEDANTAEQLARLLGSLSFATTRYQIEPDQSVLPNGDTVVVCGPKSAPIGSALLDRDPALRMVNDGHRWWLEEIAGGKRHGSPTDDPSPQPVDVAYLARHIVDRRVVVHIAGIHGSGSLGATHYLAHHLTGLFAETADAQCSLIVRTTYQDRHILDSALLAGPFRW